MPTIDGTEKENQDDRGGKKGQLEGRQEQDHIGRLQILKGMEIRKGHGI